MTNTTCDQGFGSVVLPVGSLVLPVGSLVLPVGSLVLPMGSLDQQQQHLRTY